MTYVNQLYCVIAPEGFNTASGMQPHYDTLSIYRRDAVQKFLKGLSDPWPSYYKIGYRCERIELQIIVTKPKYKK